MRLMIGAKLRSARRDACKAHQCALGRQLASFLHDRAAMESEEEGGEEEEEEGKEEEGES